MAGEAIFIGYRRDDTADVAGRMHDALAQRFGKQRIFMDVDNLRPGADFGQYIKTVLPRCRVALILIGPNWLSVRDERGARRLDDPNDWVRIEVETALATPGLDVVPVLVNGATMPRTEDLPESLRPLLRRHAAIIRRNPDFHDDVARLIAALRASVSTGILDLSKMTGDGASARGRGGGGGSALLMIGGVVIAGALAVFGLNAAGVIALPWLPSAQQIADAEPSARTFRDGQEFDDCDGAGWCPRMMVIPAGSFTMGSPEDEEGRNNNEGPQRRVSIRQFAVGKFEVTFDQWAACVNGGGCTSNASPSDEGWGRGARPVINVSWNDAREYVQWLSRETGRSYRLLSEAEWEYAARGGDRAGPYWWGAAASHEYANFGADQCCDGLASGRDQWVFTSPGGSFPANPFGLSDMHGNLFEWTQDCYAASYSGLPDDGSAYETNSCSLRVYRGGSWDLSPQYLRSSLRNRTTPTGRYDGLGFRVARTLN